MDVPVPAAAAVIGALQQLELVELYADVPSTVKAELFKLVNERSSITRASLLIADDPFTPVGGCVLPAERARFREFGHAKHEQWAEGFTSLERIALEAPQVPTASTAASGNVRFLSLAAWANGFSNGSLPLAEVFPSLEALSITTHRRVASLDCDAVTFPPSLTSLSIDGPSVKKAFRVSDFLNRALGANAPRALGKLRFGCGIDDARPLLQLRGTLVELEITGLVPEGTGAIVGQLSALRHLDAPMLARENVPQDDDATFLLSGELRSLRTLRIASLWRTTLAAVAARCPKLHRVELPQEPSAPKAYEARYWRGNDDPPWARGTWWSFERVSFGP